MLTDLCGHKGKLGGVRRIFEIQNAKTHKLTSTGVHVPGIAGNAIEIRNTLSAGGAGEDLRWKNGCGRDVEVRGNAVDVDRGCRNCCGCGDEA